LAKALASGQGKQQPHQYHQQQYQQYRGATPTNPSAAAAAAASAAAATATANQQQEQNRHKYKTELCSNYMTRGHCRFGESCKFAHGLSDLRRLTARKLLSNGIADAAHHCVRPCFVHVATGHCPFGVRCTGLHDPRVDDLTDRVVRATATDPQLAMMMVMTPPVVAVDGDDDEFFYDAAAEEDDVEVVAATGLDGWDVGGSGAGALAQAQAQAAAAAANDCGGGGGGRRSGRGTTSAASTAEGGLVGRVLRLGRAAGIDVAHADDPGRHWLDHYEHPVPGVATDLIVAHLHNHFVNGAFFACGVLVYFRSLSSISIRFIGSAQSCLVCLV